MGTRIAYAVLLEPLVLHWKEEVMEYVVSEVAQFLTDNGWKLGRGILIAYGWGGALGVLDLVCPFLIKRLLTSVLSKAASAACNQVDVQSLKRNITHFFRKRMCCPELTEVIVV